MSHPLPFGAARMPLPVNASRDERMERSRAMLSRALNLKTTIAFVGSGCSVPRGYPDWRGMVLQVIDATDASGESEDVRRRLSFASRKLRSTDPIGTEQFLSWLGLCERVLNRNDQKAFHNKVVRLFSARPQNASGVNPHKSLLQLPIHRFVTSNYDLQLEAALKRRNKGVKPDSLTQRKENHAQLAKFAIGRWRGMRDAVFHCHGSIREPETIIASEADYQRWYVTEGDAAAASFRLTLRLLFGSNPMLFVGFGMQDDDLLWPLRLLSAADPENKDSRPLFALLPEFEKNGRDDMIEFLYDRFGVNVITYGSVRPRTPVSIAKAGEQLCEAFDGIRERWETDSHEWLQKPSIRRVKLSEHAHPPHAYRHYSVELTEDEPLLAPARTREDLVDLARLVKSPDVGVVVITGDGGAGKSWRALRLMEWFGPGEFTGRFFWSSYYADDWLTGLERVLDYLKVPRDVRQARIGRLGDTFNQPNLLVFDGFERLLRQKGESPVGVPYSRTVEQLIGQILETRRTRVVLTSRLVPEPLENHPRCVIYGVRRLTTADLREGKLFEQMKANGLGDPELAALCSLCGGHSYALLLAAKFLAAPGGDMRKRFTKLTRELSQKPPDARPSKMIELAIDAVGKAASRFLERLSIFMSPVTGPALAECYRSAVEKLANQPSIETLRDTLIDARLLMNVSTVPADPALLPAFTVHPTVRSFIFQQRHGVPSAHMPNFTLAGFTSGNAAVYPGSKAGADVTRELFERLCNRSEELAEIQPETARQLCRSAFGVVRSRMEANTAPRWTNYAGYVRHGIRVASLAKRLTPPIDRWTYAERSHARKLERDDGVLYADELAWLYNDVGLSLCSEGYMADAYSVWEQGFEIDAVTDSELEGGQYIVQSRLHMAHVFLELGRLREAAEYLDATERANAAYQDVDFGARITGYRGLLVHLAGNLEEADQLYKEAVGILRKGHNLRAESLFTRHWADLMLSRDNKEDAARLARRAAILATEGDFRDLEAFARKAQAHVLRVQGDFPAAQAEYFAALEKARAFGIKRLQSDILSELGRLALDIGDWETARWRAISSLMLANELSLGLRCTHGLVVLGLATLKGGDRDLAVQYLCAAKDMADQQGYFLRGREAERELQRLGVT